MLLTIVFTTNEPAALLEPDTALLNPVIVNGCPASKLCGPTVVTVIKDEPIPCVPAEASEVTVAISKSVPGTS